MRMGRGFDFLRYASITSALAHLHQQYTEQWNLSLEQQVAPRVALTVAYVGNRTIHLQQGIRRTIRPRAWSNSSAPPIPAMGSDRASGMGWKRHYNGLQTEIEFRDWHGLTLIGSYVFSKCLDNGTDEGSAPPRN